MRAILGTEARSVESRPCLLLYTKPACPGRVKTRLIGVSSENGKRHEVTAEQAARLHGAFLGDLSERLDRWSLPPASRLGARGRRSLPRRGWSPVASTFASRGPISARGSTTGLAAAAERFTAVAAVGSDHPELEPRIVEQAFANLAERCRRGVWAGRGRRLLSDRPAPRRGVP